MPTNNFLNSINIARVKAGLSDSSMSDQDAQAFAQRHPLQALRMSGHKLNDDAINQAFAASAPPPGLDKDMVWSRFENHAVRRKDAENFIAYSPSNLAKTIDDASGGTIMSDFEGMLYDYYSDTARDGDGSYDHYIAATTNFAAAVPSTISMLLTEPLFGVELSTPLDAITQGIDDKASAEGNTSMKAASIGGQVGGMLYGGSLAFKGVQKSIGLLSKAGSYIPQAAKYADIVKSTTVGAALMKAPTATLVTAKLGQGALAGAVIDALQDETLLGIALGADADSWLNSPVSSVVEGLIIGAIVNGIVDKKSIKRIVKANMQESGALELAAKEGINLDLDEGLGTMIDQAIRATDDARMTLTEFQKAVKGNSEKTFKEAIKPKPDPDITTQVEKMPGSEPKETPTKAKQAPTKAKQTAKPKTKPKIKAKEAKPVEDKAIVELEAEKSELMKRKAQIDADALDPKLTDTIDHRQLREESLALDEQILAIDTKLSAKKNANHKAPEKEKVKAPLKPDEPEIKPVDKVRNSKQPSDPEALAARRAESARRNADEIINKEADANLVVENRKLERLEDRLKQAEADDDTLMVGNLKTSMKGVEDRIGDIEATRAARLELNNAERVPKAKTEKEFVGNGEKDTPNIKKAKRLVGKAKAEARSGAVKIAERNSKNTETANARLNDAKAELDDALRENLDELTTARIGRTADTARDAKEAADEQVSHIENVMADVKASYQEAKGAERKALAEEIKLLNKELKRARGTAGKIGVKLQKYITAEGLANKGDLTNAKKVYLSTKTVKELEDAHLKGTATNWAKRKADSLNRRHLPDGHNISGETVDKHWLEYTTSRLKRLQEKVTSYAKSKEVLDRRYQRTRNRKNPDKDYLEQLKLDRADLRMETTKAQKELASLEQEVKRLKGGTHEVDASPQKVKSKAGNAAKGQLKYRKYRQAEPDEKLTKGHSDSFRDFVIDKEGGVSLQTLRGNEASRTLVDAVEQLTDFTNKVRNISKRVSAATNEKFKPLVKLMDDWNRWGQGHTRKERFAPGGTLPREVKGRKLADDREVKAFHKATDEMLVEASSLIDKMLRNRKHYDLTDDEFDMLRRISSRISAVNTVKAEAGRITVQHYLRAAAPVGVGTGFDDAEDQDRTGLVVGASLTLALLGYGRRSDIKLLLRQTGDLLSAESRIAERLIKNPSKKVKDYMKYRWRLGIRKGADVTDKSTIAGKHAAPRTARESVDAVESSRRVPDATSTPEQEANMLLTSDRLEAADPGAAKLMDEGAPISRSKVGQFIHDIVESRIKADAPLGRILSYFSHGFAKPQDFTDMYRKTRGAQAMWDRAIKKLGHAMEWAYDKKGHKIRRWNKEEKDYMFRLMNGENVVSPLTNQGELMDIAMQGRKLFDEAGQWYVDLGFLKQSTYDKNKGQYVTRLWAEIEAAKAGFGKEEIASLSGGSALKVLGHRSMKRGDEAEISKRLTKICEPAYPTYQGLKSIMNDVVNGTLFKGIANNAQWSMMKKTHVVLQRVKNGSLDKLSKGDRESLKWLKDNGHVEYTRLSNVTLTDQGETFLQRTYRQNHIQKDKGITNAKGKTKAFNRWGQSTFGQLNDMVVIDSIALDLQMMDDMFQKGAISKYYGQFLSAWKWGRILINPATHSRNMMSNMILADLGGMSPADPKSWKAIKKAAEQIYRDQGDEIYIRCIQQGLIRQGNLQGLNTEAKSFFANTYLREGNPWKRGALEVKAGIEGAYQAEEDLMKLAMVRYFADQGHNVDDAIELARRSLFDYSEIPPVVKWARKGWSPFITFSYKALPRVMQTAVTHPVRLAKYMALFGGMQAMSHEFFGEQDMANADDVKGDYKEWEDHVKPEYLKNTKIGGVELMDKSMRLPFLDKHGRSQYLDLQFILPWGDFTGGLDGKGGLANLIIPEGSKLAFMRHLPGWIQPQFPFAKEAMELLNNKSLFTGQKIVKDGDPNPKTTMFDYMWRSIAPSITPVNPSGLWASDDVNKLSGIDALRKGEYATAVASVFRDGGYSYNKFVNALEEIPDYRGRTRTMVAVLGDIMTGIKTTPMLPQERSRMLISNHQRAITTLKSDLSGIRRNKKYTPGQVKAREDFARQEIQRHYEEIRAISEFSTIISQKRNK